MEFARYGRTDHLPPKSLSSLGAGQDNVKIYFRKWQYYQCFVLKTQPMSHLKQDRQLAPTTFASRCNLIFISALMLDCMAGAVEEAAVMWGPGAAGAAVPVATK